MVVGGWWLTIGRFESAPNFVAQTREQAEAMAAEAGLVLQVDGGLFREDVPKGTVLAQDPAAGQKIAKGGTITLTLSNGPERYLVPNVAGKSVANAKADL